MFESLAAPSVFKGLYIFWALCCITATIFTVTLQCLSYFEDEDVTRLEYKRFQEDVKDLYPSIGFCFTMPIREERLRHYGLNVTPQAYSDFLTGKSLNEEMLKIDYDDVIQHLEQYILGYGYVNLKLEEVLLTSSVKNITKKRSLGFREFSFLSAKCVRIDIPFNKSNPISYFFIALRTDIFIEGKRLDNPSDHLLKENQFIVALHYPNQLLGNIVTGIRKWPFRGNVTNRNYVMQFNIRNIEVSEKRNKYMTPCTHGVPDVDDEIMEKVLSETGCKPPYWNSSSSLPLCLKSEDMEKAANLIEGVAFGHVSRKKIIETPPCRTLEKQQFDVFDAPHPENFEWKEEITMWFDFKELTYKEVKNIRSMDRQALVGN